MEQQEQQMEQQMSSKIVVYGHQQVAYEDPDVTPAQREAWALDGVQAGLNAPFIGDIPAAARLGCAMRTAAQWGYQQLWFLRDCPYRLTAEAMTYAQHGGWRFNAKATPASRWLMAFGPNGARLALMFVGDEDAHTWGMAGDAWELLRAVEAYHTHVGQWWTWSGGISGQRLMVSVHAGTTATQLDLPYGPPPPATKPPADGVMHWCQRLTPERLAGKVINSFDVNAQYLAACSSLALGVGEWRHVSTSDECALVPRDAPGYWRVQTPARGATPLAVPLVDGRRLLKNADWLDCWVSTPTMQLLREMNVVYWLSEVYWWPRHHQYLSPWYKRLRTAREALLSAQGDGHRVALAAVKDTYAAGIGSLNSWQKRDHPDQLYRPDWRDAVISQARANEWRALWRVFAATHQTPFAVGADCAYYLGDRDGDLPPLRTGLGLGQWKRKDIAVPADHPAIARVLTSALAGPSRVTLLQGTLNALRDGRNPDAIWDRYMKQHVEMAEIREEGMFSHAS
jgi:hypothetical protein